MKAKESFIDILDRIIRRYKTAVLGTLLIHAFFMMGLILWEINKPEELEKEDFITLDMIEEMIQPQETTTEDMQGSEDNEDLKNIASNESDQNKSYDDYYGELKQIVDQSKGTQTFKAENYDDKRWLIKDYSQEYKFSEEVHEQKTESSQTQKQSSNNTYAGKTIISYALDGRKAVKLPVPAYQCMGSGEVIVDIVVNQNGKVISAEIRTSTTPSGETCLPDAARTAALKSRFSIDLKAPTQHSGHITYKFVAQ